MSSQRYRFTSAQGRGLDGLGRPVGFCLSLVLCLLMLPGGVWGASWHPFDGRAGEGPATFRVVSADQDRVTLEVLIPGMLTEDVALEGKTYQRISLPEADHTWDVGLPQLPEVSTLLAIPGTAGVVATVKEMSTAEVPGLLVYPAQPPTTDQAPSGQFVVNDAFYAGGEAYPREPLATGEPQIWRDVRVSRLYVRPFTYRPDTGTLTACTRMLVEVRFLGFDARASFTYGERPVLSHWASRYESAVINYAYLGLPVLRGKNPGYDFLVITTDALRDSVVALADWHDREGLKTDVVPLSQIGTTTDLIKNYIITRHSQDNISAVLLVGDIANLPIRYVYTSIDPNTPSDHWYACLDGGSDYTADVDLARLSATTGTGVAHQVRKILTYEITPPVDAWTTKTILCAYERSDYIQCKNDIAAFAYDCETPPAFEKCYAGQGGTRTQLIQAIETGVGLVNYRGHGYYQEWSWSVGWTNTHIHALENGTHYSLVFNCCCENGHLDLAAECLAEAWMNADHAAAGNLAASRSSYTDPNHTFDRELYKAIFDSCKYGTMEVVNYAKNKVSGSDLGRDNNWMYLWLGDPIMQIWTGIPDALIVDHPSIAFMGMAEFTVQVSDAGGPLPGARVCLRSETGDVYEVGTTGPGGSVTLSLAGATVPQDLDITVTAHNYLPYLTTIPILPPGGPSLVCTDREIDDDAVGDSDGNDDANLDAGETIEFLVTLKNTGGETAPAVTATLTSSSPHVSILDGFEEYGDIPPWESRQCLDHYVFEVSSSTPDGEDVEFLLTMSSGDSIWYSPFSYTVHAPVLTVSSYQVLDPTGDGDGVADPGENVQLRMWLGNQGGAEARQLITRLSSTTGLAEVTADSAGALLVPAGGTVVLLPTFQVSIPADVPLMSLAPMMIEATGAWDLAWTAAFHLSIGAFRDDVEDGIGGWTHSLVTPGFVDQWRRTNFENHTTGGRWAWKFGDPLEGPYANMSDGGLVSQQVQVGSGSHLAFWHKMDAETSVTYPGSAYDGGIVEVSLEGGPWQQIAPEGGYPYLTRIGTPPSPFAEGTPCFSGTHTWRQATFDLSAFSGMAQIRFRFGSDAAGAREGWVVDDIEVTGSLLTEVEGTTLELTPAPAQVVLHQNRPNPFNPVTAIEYGLPREMRADLAVFDVAGRLVRTLAAGVEVAGVHATVWDGRDETGNSVASGIYFYRLVAGEETLTRSMVLLK